MKTLLPAAIILCGLSAAINSSFAQTWIQQTNAPSENWVSIASSADGSKLVAVANNFICTSTNSGTIWTLQTNAPIVSWCSVASSADGVELVAAVNGGDIYTSTNSGVIWTQQTNAPNVIWD